MNLPNLQIVDYGYGYTGSTHDATAWEQTRIFKEHDTVFEGKEFVWGDSAYPIQTWVVCPFKVPESELADNAVYNECLSSLRIRSEHAIGFLKGRFQSLKGLCVRILDEKSHKWAGYWAVCCIAVHAFALRSEDAWRRSGAEANSDSDNTNDPFIRAGLSGDEGHDAQQSNMGFGDHGATAQESRRSGRASELSAAKDRRNELKASILASSRGRQVAENQMHY